MSGLVAHDNGIFPYDWQRECVGSAFDLQLGKMLSKAAKTGQNARHYLGNKNVQWDRVDLSELESMDFTKSEQEKYSLRHGDLLVCEGGEVGRTAMWKGEIDDCYYQKAIHRLRPKSGTVESAYMLQFMRLASTNGWFIKYTSQSSITHLTREKLALVPISFPSLPEQKKIARILTTVDNLIEKTEALIEKYKAIKQGMMHDLFTRGVDQNGKLRPPYEAAPHLYKESPLGWIPKEWETMRLDDASVAIVDCPHSTPEYISDGVLVARTSQIKDGLFEVTGASFVSESEYFMRIARLAPQAGDLIFTREAPVGEAFIIPENMRICLGQRVMLIRLNSKKCTSKFILSLIYSSGVRERFDQQTGGTTNPHLNVEDIRKLPIVVPMLDEQVVIGNKIQSLIDKLQVEIKFVQKLRLQKTGLMQDLLTGKVRVNIDEAEGILTNG